MLSKEEIEKAKERLKLLSIGDFVTWFTNDGIIDMEMATKTLFQYIDQLEQENKNLKEFFIVTGGKDIEDITATQYIKIKQEGYIQGRIEEQDKLLKCINKLNKMIDEYKEYYESTYKRFRHLIKSKFIEKYDQYDYKKRRLQI